MTLTKEIHEKIILQYLGAECMIECHSVYKTTISIETVNEFRFIKLDIIKPLLTPLDKISEEHLKTLGVYNFEDILWGINNVFFGYELFKIYQQLQAWHYAMPDYIYLDGKTPIQAGIAIYKTTYNEKK